MVYRSGCAKNSVLWWTSRVFSNNEALGFLPSSSFDVQVMSLLSSAAIGCCSDLSQAGCKDVMLAVRFKTLHHESASGSRGLGRPLKPRRFGGNPGRGRIERERNSFGVPIPGERPGRPPLLVALPPKDHHRYFLAGIPSRILRSILAPSAGPRIYRSVESPHAVNRNR